MNPLELKIWRVRAGLTQYEVAQRVGIHPIRVSEMERGQRPIAEAVVRVLEEALAGVTGTGSDG